MKTRKIISVLLVMMSITVVVNANTIDNLENTKIALKNSLSNEFSQCTPSEFNEWLELFDSNGIRYAHLVKLYDSIGQVEGFSIISDINNKVLMTATGDNFAELIKSITEIVGKQKGQYQLIYEFPHGFYIKNDKEIRQIYLYGKTYIKEEIPANTLDTVEFLQSQPQNQPVALASTVYGQLNNWDLFDFVPVQLDGTNSYYYGGYQGWLEDEGVSEFFANRSCGVTAASNMFQYMSDNVSGMSNLYTRSSMLKSEFSKFQKDVYEYINPAIWGIPGLDTMIEKVKEFASSRGVTLNENLSSATWNETNVRDYIAGGLNNERPVLLITWNSVIPDLTNHWVTVTKIYGSPGSTTMVTSNWGGKVEYDFSLWVQGSSLYKGVIYFD